MVRPSAVILVFLLGAISAWAADPDLGRHFEGINGSFVLLNGKTGRYIRHNPEGAAVRYAPCSTFKIANSAVGLETGVVPDAAFKIAYDPALKMEGQGPNGAWAQDHTLASAFKASVVWYYQEVARKVGQERMSRMLYRMGYGNQDISGPIDQFWLGRGGLRISADEQVQFLQRLYEGKAGLSPRTTAILKEIMIADEGPGWKLSAKTGACGVPGEQVVLWYVGWVERKDGVHYFATQMVDKQYAPLFNQRISKTRQILSELRLIEEPAVSPEDLRSRKK